MNKNKTTHTFDNFCIDIKWWKNSKIKWVFAFTHIENVSWSLRANFGRSNLSFWGTFGKILLLCNMHQYNGDYQLFCQCFELHSTALGLLNLLLISCTARFHAKCTRVSSFGCQWQLATEGKSFETHLGAQNVRIKQDQSDVPLVLNRKSIKGRYFVVCIEIFVSSICAIELCVNKPLFK